MVRWCVSWICMYVCVSEFACVLMDILYVFVYVYAFRGFDGCMCVCVCVRVY